MGMGVEMRKLMLSAMLLVGAPVAFAHSDGKEARKVADCERLPGTASAGERGQCLKCVQRPQKHHYHPDAVPGARCLPEDHK
jgi:hypothetical protein